MLCPMVNRLTYSSDVFQPVEKEDHADQKQQMVVAGDHVLGAEVEKRARSLVPWLATTNAASRLETL